MMETVMTTEEVAKLLKVSETTIYRQAEKFILPGFKIGRQWRFLRKELENFIQVRSSWKQKLQSLLDEFQQEGVKKGVTEEIVAQEASMVRINRRRK
ncbi:MAG: hypothetical protein COX46_02060 [bacterium (Candidatus Ratteibacteria) CG23_combo_of_CG06-09_8_20_14_all_48_7]|uniref:Helix-turn-helix domain-containing protein n=1 Tax=bacterium (Candidatus Ratteibacteria) CG23_combo_of_CG06-09_8_20_14_all_48_7 TaxID=2014292 RepID=A0A2G9YB79_9BACT|nr:MAG: hypothetical protein COX46_02060 [bacterium (Candidatus Ratteibacteria) CG23_combo_of_CG06-09_8_20_14_all_48_7]